MGMKDDGSSDRAERGAERGRFLGIPYDWRWPSWARIRTRMWWPGGPMCPPKTFGWGWTLNFAHPGTWILLGAGALVAVILAALGY